MKILFYINTISHGGAERVMVNLATAFAEAGNDCILVTSYSSEWEYPIHESVKRVTLTKSTIAGIIQRNLTLTKLLRRQIKDENPDLVISFMAEPSFRALFATMGLPSKNLISIRNDPNREYPNFLFRFLAKTLYRRAHGVVFQTEDAKQWFPKGIQKKSMIIYNQVDEKFYETEPIRERHDIVTTGRLVPQKNQAMLIRSFASIANQFEDNLIIYGDGMLRDELEVLVRDLHMEERIFLPGSVKNVPETIVGAKAFVLPSNFEGMPNSLLEAMALGLPCISTDCPCGGPKMLIDNKKNGILIPLADEKALALALKTLLTSPEYAQQLGQNAKVSAEQFHPRRIFEKWDEYVRKTVYS